MRNNRAFCQKHGIGLSGPKLGRPSKGAAKFVLIAEMLYVCLPMLICRDWLRHQGMDIVNTQSVMLRIRRGDFVRLNWAALASLYREAVECLKAKIQNPLFSVFSDEIAWCRENEGELGLSDTAVTYVEGNERGNNFIDMQLMI